MCFSVYFRAQDWSHRTIDEYKKAFLIGPKVNVDKSCIEVRQFQRFWSNRSKTPSPPKVWGGKWSVYEHLKNFPSSLIIPTVPDSGVISALNISFEKWQWRGASRPVLSQILISDHTTQHQHEYLWITSLTTTQLINSSNKLSLSFINNCNQKLVNFAERPCATALLLFIYYEIIFLFKKCDITFMRD